MVILPVDRLMVPLLLMDPVAVNVLVFNDNVAPAFTVTPATVVVAPTVTWLAPVVAIMTLSVVAGATPPTQVDPVAYVPPVAVLVRVAPNAVVVMLVTNWKATSTKIFDRKIENLFV
jgi:hypothetical protein